MNSGKIAYGHKGTMATVGKICARWSLAFGTNTAIFTFSFVVWRVNPSISPRPGRCIPTHQHPSRKLWLWIGTFQFLSLESNAKEHERGEEADGGRLRGRWLSGSCTAYMPIRHPGHYWCLLRGFPLSVPGVTLHSQLAGRLSVSTLILLVPSLVKTLHQNVERVAEKGDLMESITHIEHSIGWPGRLSPAGGGKCGLPQQWPLWKTWPLLKDRK